MGRVEGRLRRPVLEELHIDSVEALYANLAGLWKFMTEWASLRLRDNENTGGMTNDQLPMTHQSFNLKKDNG